MYPKCNASHKIRHLNSTAKSAFSLALLNVKSIVFFYRDWIPFINSNLEGVYVDIWNVLEQNLNFTTQLTSTEANWNSMMYSVNNGTFDLVLTGNSLTLTRHSFVDFSLPLMDTSLRLVYLRSSKSTKWLTYFKSYLTDSWLAILASLATIFILFASIIFLSPFKDWSMKTLIAFLYLSHLGRRFPREPRKMSLKVAFVSVSFCGFMLITLYRCMISASMAIQIMHHPVQSLREVLNSPFNILVTEGTSIHSYFKDASEDSYLNEILQSDKFTLVQSASEAIERVSEGEGLNNI